MTRLPLTALWLLTLLLPGAAWALDADRYGEVKLLTPQGEPRGMVIMFSDRNGWSEADQSAASALAQQGALVAGVDSRYYTSRLNETKVGCHVLIGDAEGLSRYVQRLHGAQGYLSPILFGVGEGGTLAAATLQQARANTVAGAVSLDLKPLVASDAPPCTSAETQSVDARVAEHGPGPLQGFWRAAFHPEADSAPRDRLARWAAAGTPVTLQDLPADIDETAAALSLVVPHLQTVAPPPEGDIAGLPLTELPATAPTDRLAIVISGDGGWRDIDKSVAEDLRAQGTSVVGWDALRYFWHSRTPEQLARDLATVMRVYGTRWHARHVALVGYSFGADVMPFAFNRLPSDLRAEVSLIALLAFSTAADFEISVTGWLGAPPTDAALPVGPEMQRVPPGLVQCFYGEGETDSDCPDLTGAGIEVVRMPGGHHFGGDYGTVARRIGDGLRRRIG